MVKVVRRVEKDRLVYYRDKADQAYWDNVWEANGFTSIYDHAREGRMDFPEWETLFPKYLPKDERIIEAGCGRGQIVLSLGIRGYDVEGVEYAPQTVEKVKSIFPDLAIRSGDVTALDVPDGTYGGYISIGVIEHRQDGPEPFLDEACRILKPGGIGLISVPFFNPFRQFKARLGFYRGNPSGLEFYQYAFQQATYQAFLEKAGFEVIDWEYYTSDKGFRDEVPFGKQLLKASLSRKRLSHRLLHRPRWHQGFAHMIMAVVRKS
ncbi:hypothetical protein MASR2M15_24240 [Anaerolineales bacterium]